MLYLIRHGITEWNVIKRLQGQTDVPLNEEGRKMAQAAHDEYKDVHFDICFASPLVRAKETAEILLKDRDIPIEYDDRLKEMGFGENEGMLNYRDESSSISVLFRTPEKYTSSINGSETFDELFARTGEFLAERVEPLLKENKDVLIVGHGAMNSSIVCRMKGRSYEDFWKEGIPNCKLIKL